MDIADTAKKYKDGETILRQGDRGRSMYIVRRGKVRIFRGQDGTETTLGVIEPGGMFGEMSLFEDLPRSASAQAVGETELQTMSPEEFDALTSDPIVRRVLRQMAARLREVDKHYEQFSVEAQHRREFLSALPLRHDYGQ